MDEKPNIFEYDSYRVYLKDFFEFKKKSKKGYSYRQFSKKAKFSSSSVLTRIISGDRRIGESSIKNFILGLELDEQEEKYFTNLVFMNNENDPEKIKYYENILKKLSAKKAKELLTEDKFQYLSHWLYLSIEEMANFDDFTDDPKWIKSKLVDQDISEDEIISVVMFLKNNGFVKKNSNGKYETTDKTVAISSKKRSLAIRRLHRLLMEQSVKLYEILEKEDRAFRSVTLCVPKDKVDSLKKEIDEFKNSMLEKYSASKQQSTENCSVAQLNLQFFKHTI